MFSWPRGRNARTWTSLVALLLGACGGSSDPSVPTEISLNTTTLAFTSVGGTQQLSATVLDQRGDPLPGAAVAWSSSNEIVATVSPTGLVTATGPGSTEITASSGEATTTADVSVTQVVATFEQVSGDGQAAVAGQTLPQPLVVRARDASGSAIPNLTVSFETIQGGGNVIPEEAETGPDGTASAVLTVGPNPGQAQQVLATIAGTDFTTTFSATSTNPAAVVEVFAGNGQSAAAGANVPVAPAVRALDAADQPVAGVQVRFEVTTGGGSVSGALKTTNAQGVATLDSWTLGPVRDQHPERFRRGTDRLGRAAHVRGHYRREHRVQHHDPLPGHAILFTVARLRTKRRSGGRDSSRVICPISRRVWTPMTLTVAGLPAVIGNSRRSSHLRRSCSRSMAPATS